MKIHDAVGQFLIEQEVETVFTLMAEDIFGITAGLQATAGDGVRVVETRHEQCAVAEADGYSRATDDIGVAVVGRGPAIAQTGTALRTADEKSSKTLVITSDTPHTATQDVKGFSQQAFLESLVSDVRSVRDPTSLLPAFVDIFHTLRQNGGPIVVQIPWDVMETEAELPEGWEERIANAGTAIHDRSHLEPPEEDIEQTIELLLDSDAEIPMTILAGNGAVTQEAKAAIESLAERTSAILLSTLQANGLFSEHPYSPGFVGTFGTPLANESLAQSEFVLAVGCSLNDHTTDNGRLINESATVVHVNTDPSAINRHLTVDYGIVGDVTTVVSRLDEALASAGIDRGERFWTPRLKRRVAESPRWTEQTIVKRPDRIDQRELVTRLDSLLPEDRFVVTDGGHFINWVLDGIQIQHPDDYEWTIDFGAVGVGLPISIGAAMAGVDRTVVAFCGDSGFLMSSPELDTAVRHGLGLIIIVMNDDALGSEYHQLQNKRMAKETAIVETPDIAALANANGATGHRIESVDDLERIAPALKATPENPVVLDCKIERDVRHRFYDTDHMM